MPKEGINYKEYVEMLNNSPIFTSIAKNLDYKRIGLQIINNERVVEEYTSHNKDRKIAKVEKGLKNPEFTIKIEESTVKQITSPKEQAWIKKHPIEAALKYAGKVDMPFMIKLKLLRILTKT